VTFAAVLVCWLGALIVLVFISFGIGMDSWADQQDNGGARYGQLRHEAAVAELWLAGVALVGPLVLAGVAGAAARPRAVVLFLVLAAVLAVPSFGLAADGLKTLSPQRPPPRPSHYCPEYSGADNHCPGG
jgi:hypothetical protein